MSSVFVIIVESLPTNGTYPASSNYGFYADEDTAWEALQDLSFAYGEEVLGTDDTLFYGLVNPEQFEYIEYRIEEHVIRTGENQ